MPWPKRPIPRESILCPALLALALTGYYFAWLAPRNYTLVILTWDAFRDIIAARHLLAGGAAWADPVIKDFWFWYPPTNAALFSALHSLTGIDLYRLYALSPAILNIAFSPAFYLVCLRLFDRSHAVAFWTTLGLALMPWPVTYVFAFPTVMAHAAAPALLILWAYIGWLKRPRLKLFVTLSAATGLMGLYHPPTCVLLVSSIAFHRLLARDAKHLLILIALAGAISSPYWLVQLSEPVLNPVPIRYVAPAMLRPEVALPGFGTWPGLAVLAFGAWGGIRLFRQIRKPAVGFLLLFFALMLAGQAPALLDAWLRSSAPEWHERFGEWVPLFVPHEFQLYSQITLAWIAGFGIKAFIEQRTSWKPLAFWGAVLIALIGLGDGLYRFAERSQAFCEPYRLQGEWIAPVSFINEHINHNEVICAPDDHVSFFITGLRSGAKSLASFESHLNPRADYHARAAARKAIMQDGDEAQTREAIARYEVRYILAWSKKTSRERITLFQTWFKTVYNDGTVYLFDARSAAPGS